MTALHDSDPKVRRAAATLEKVVADDSVVSAMRTALDDPSDEVRLAAAVSLADVLFESSAVVPALIDALGDPRKAAQVLEALDGHFEKTTDQADFGRAQVTCRSFRATLKAAIPALRKALTVKDDDIRLMVFTILGRIIAFSRLSRDADLAKAIEPTLPIYLKGLERKQSGHPSGSAWPARFGLDEPRGGGLNPGEVSGSLRQSGGRAAGRFWTMAAQAACADSGPALGQALNPAVPILVKALGDPKTEIREAAIQALGNMGGEGRPAEQALQELAQTILCRPFESWPRTP